MKIVIMDSWNGKFSADIRDHWLSLGHQVILNPNWDAMKEADITFFYQADNGLVIASTEKKPHSGKVFGQCVDIEVWAGQATAVDWTYTDGCIFMAQHIKDRVPITSVPTKIIKPGINLDKWTLRPPFKPEDPIKKIAYVVGERRIWDVKRLDIAFQMLRDCLNVGKNVWQLHIRGTYSSHEQYNAYCKYLEKNLELEGFVFWYPDRIEDMNTWLNDKDCFLLPSTKEAFSYATAETMAKGIKPIINNWESSKETWGKYVCNTYGEMLAELLKGEYKPEEYRQYIVDNYDSKRYFKELDEFILGG